MRTSCFAFSFLMLASLVAEAQDASYNVPFPVAPFQQQVHQPYTTVEGLPSNDVTRVDLEAGGRVVAITAEGTAVFDGVQWRADTTEIVQPLELSNREFVALQRIARVHITIRDVAERDGETAVAADTGLYIGAGRRWRLALPRQGDVRWAPVDVRAVTYDADGALWFAAPQGVGCRLGDDEWKLFTGADGLPFNDFTCMAAGPDSVWFGTTNGAIQYRDGAFHFRQGGRWLLDNHVRAIAVDTEGTAWLATSAGVSAIAYRPMTLASKARFFHEEIEKYHRRTSFGYVCPAVLSTPGDRSTAKPKFTDNDGFYTGLYLGAVSLGYAATKDPALKEDAHKAFRALAFLSEVTQGGSHPAPKGFYARAVRPTSLPDPNTEFGLDYDIRRQKADTLWKIIQPRWPVDETGEWYWKCDSSPDELDGHFFGYGIYFDRVCESESEKDAVRAVVRRIVDHILDHGYNIVDWDGKPTRWGHFSPDDLNRNEAWVVERGLNSFSILTYLSVAYHVTGDAKYREAMLTLALKHGYGMNGMTQPKDYMGPGSYGQPDDNMAFLNYYHLIRYETDPKLLSMFTHAIHRHWQLEQYERNPFTNFIYAACCLGKVRTDQWGDTGLSPPRVAFEDAIDTLKRYPLDLVEWPMSNAHRTDMVPLLTHLDQRPGAGHRVDNHVFPIDERHELRWDLDPYFLSYAGDGTSLRDGAHYLLAYYMGLAHGFLTE